jgi:hypothetical protein
MYGTGFKKQAEGRVSRTDGFHGHMGCVEEKRKDGLKKKKSKVQKI